MPSETIYTDTSNNAWDLKLTLADARRIDQSDFSTNGYYTEKFSFMIPDKSFFSNLIANTNFMFALIWVIIQPQVKAKYKNGIFKVPGYPLEANQTPELIETLFNTQEFLDRAELEFVSAIDGQVIELAKSALWRSLQDFFPQQKTVLSILLRQQKLTWEKVESKEQLLETTISEAMDKGIDQEIELFKTKMNSLQSIQET